MTLRGDYGSGTPGVGSFSSTVGGNVANAESATTNRQFPGAGLEPYDGIVATRCGCIDGGYSAGQTVSINRSAHIATEHITRLRVIYPAWRVTQNAETGLDASSNMILFIEYPVGKTTRMTFNGEGYSAQSPSSTWSANATTAGENFSSDWLTIDIPKGAVFYMRPGFQFTTATANGMPSNGSMLPNWGAGAATGSYWEGVKLSTNPADLSLAGTDSTGGSSGSNTGFNTNFSNRFVPLAIIGRTTRPSFFLAGDSIMCGVGDAADGQLACGWMARALGNNFGYFQAGVSGESVQGLTGASQFAKRGAMAQYCSHVVSAYGTNDVSGGRTPAQCIADIAAFRNKWFAGMPFYVCTLASRTTSTDGWITELNQTPVASDANLALFNDQIRLGAFAMRFNGVLDVDQITQNSYTGRKWKAFGTTVNRMTADGTHPALFGSQYIAAQTNIGRILD